jgi:hypothetical protein
MRPEEYALRTYSEEFAERVRTHPSTDRVEGERGGSLGSSPLLEPGARISLIRLLRKRSAENMRMQGAAVAEARVACLPCGSF